MDCLSRLTFQKHKWSLDDDTFLRLCSRWGTPHIDVFASATNKKCALFCSCTGDGLGSIRDAFLMTWSPDLLYLFPLFPLLLHTIVKLHRDNSLAILIAPLWPRQPWFLALRSLAISYQCLLNITHLLSQNNRQILHPTLHLTAWHICWR